MKISKFNKILSKVEKPSRYTGGEYNIIIKDHKSVSAKICLVFPEVYELGMSYVGFKILYHYINSFKEYCAERAYMPWPDMGSLLLTNSILLKSIETKTDLQEFDILGFTLQSEFSYTNVLAILKLSGIAYRSEDRTEVDPIIIAGGPNTVNPMPMYPFFDVFIIGDGENLIIDIMNIVSDKKLSRIKKLENIFKLKGTLVPQLYKKDKKIVQNIINDLDSTFFPSKQLVPFLQCIHDRGVIEIMRGCPHGCRFCQAGYIYRPVRTRTKEKVKELAVNILENTGYDDISLSSLSTGDYPDLKEVVEFIMKNYSKDKISISLPSLRIDSATFPVFKTIQSVKKTGVTFAPEAGSQRLRDIINKKITDEQIIEAISILCEAGWHKIKLYFIIGLPYETEEDIDKMIELIKNIIKTGRAKTKLFNINITLSTFIPKPHTPFQWCSMKSEEYIKKAVKKVCTSFNRRQVKVNWNDYEESTLECILCRGDEKISSVILNSFLDGCTYDGWNEYMNFSIWKKNLDEAGIDIEKLKSSIPVEQELPWDIIDTGAGKETLLREYKNAENKVTSIGCGTVGKCKSCEACGRADVS